MILDVHERPSVLTETEPTGECIPVCVSKHFAVQAVSLTCVRGRVRVLDGLDLAVKQGEILAITGANGAGKTTLIKSVAGALRPHSGGLIWFGHASAPSAAVRRHIGYAGHECGLYRDLTAFENLLFSARMHGLDSPGDIVANLLRESGLERIADCLIAKLSQGICRRLAIARAIIHRPKLILLDEPFTSLDIQGQMWLERQFQKWRLDGATVCFSSHNLDHCRGLAHRVVRLDRGRIMASASRSP